MAEARREARYEDLQDLPDNMVGEIVDGELHVSPRPAARHAAASATIGFDIGGPFHRGRGGPGGWWILDEPEIHLGRQVLVPDLAGWRRERMPIIPDVAAFELSPDWVCEILSPATARHDRFRKVPIYAGAGVRHLWIVDPRLRTVEVYRLHDGHWLLVGTHAGDAPFRAEPFDAIELDPLLWWGGEPESPGEAGGP